MQRAYAVILGALGVAFCLRVSGQLLVASFQVEFLPPMSEWYSGLLPYPLLLPIQLLILVAQAKVSLDIWRGAGFFANRRPRAGRALCWFSGIYFVAMAIRYGVVMTLFPERRWFGGTIPIVFHWVLAAYLFVLGRYQRGAAHNSSMQQGTSASSRT